MYQNNFNKKNFYMNLFCFYCKPEVEKNSTCKQKQFSKVVLSLGKKQKKNNLKKA